VSKAQKVEIRNILRKVKVASVGVINVVAASEDDATRGILKDMETEGLVKLRRNREGDPAEDLAVATNKLIYSNLIDEDIVI
jgi:hypothetical protein